MVELRQKREDELKKKVGKNGIDTEGVIHGQMNESIFGVFLKRLDTTCTKVIVYNS